MYLFADVFWAPKIGNTEEEYEDAFFPKQKFEGRRDTFNFAIADGATESSFSALWARLLVKAVGAGRLSPNSIEPALSKLKSCWDHSVSKKTLPWFAEEKARVGAFSTLLGLFLRESEEEGRQWEAFAIGDSCLFQVRGDHLLLRFPLCNAEEFTSRPILLSSREQIGDGRESIKRHYGEWNYEDHFFMMTDALAHWFLTRYELGEKPWVLLQSLGSRDFPADFRSWLNELRKSNSLKNDDVTLWRINISQDP